MINQHMTAICGISIEDHIGRSVRETVPQVADQVEQIVQAILRTGEPITGIEVNGQRPDGSNVDRVWITYWHPLKNRAGTSSGSMSPPRKLPSESVPKPTLAASQDQLRNLNETLAQRVEAQAQERDRIWKLSQDLLVVNDLNGIILHVNPAWSVTLGWSPDDLVGKSGEWLVHPDDRERSMAELPNLVAGQKTRRLENRIICKDGSYRWLSWSAVPDRGFIYANARDITDLKQAQEQLDTLRHQLADASRQTTMGAMTASIAHELNQPLAAIVTNGNAGLRWLANATPDFDEVRAALQRVVSDGHRASQVIGTIRSMFKKDGQKKAPVNVNQLIQEVLGLMQGALQNQRVSLQSQLEAQPIQVLGDRVQLQQVILNLITNAIDAMGSVTERPRVLRVRSETKESDVVITVEDSGAGIDPKSTDRIFDTFYTTKADGMGIGLAICRSIIEAHGGRIGASPGNPHGCIFQVVLPACKLRRCQVVPDPAIDNRVDPVGRPAKLC